MNKTIPATIALASCAWLSAQAASAQTIVQIASTPEGCRIYLSGKDFIAEGCNVHVRDNSGYTWCDNTNSTPPATDNCDNTGNLVVGWNGDDLGPRVRTGNHNLVVGDDNDYTAYGSLIAGVRNVVSGAYSTVTGGWANTASGENASICGGFGGVASGSSSSIAGGARNETHGSGSAAVGGIDNIAEGVDSLVAGGSDNIANGNFTVVLGGRDLVAESSPYPELTTIVGGLEIATGIATMPANGSGNTVVGANSRSSIFQISFGQTMPCTPLVTTQMFNSGGSQIAPFILSINRVTSTFFDYYLINPSATSQTAYTANIHWTAICE